MEFVHLFIAFKKYYKAVLYVLAAGLLAVAALLWNTVLPACTNIACVKKSNPEFNKRFDKQVPLYITADSIRYWYGKKDTPEKLALISAIDRLAEPAKRTSDALERQRPVSCAVVGNSDNVIGMGYGPLIDAHDLVFRMNNAPIEAFSTDLGTRTTHHVMHVKQASVRLYEPGTVTIMVVDDYPRDYVDAASRQRYLAYVDKKLRWLAAEVLPGSFPAKIPPNSNMLPEILLFPDNIADVKGGILVMHPTFLYHIRDKWYFHYRRPMDFPSIGFKTLILSMYMCDQIDVFGFTTGSPSQQWDHYFEQRSQSASNAAAHGPQYQQAFLENMEKLGVIHIYRGNARPNTVNGVNSK